MSRPPIRDLKKTVSPLDFTNARAMPTINELIAAQRRRRMSEASPL
jgi:hypothetical protein